jgi:hypothetical protein
LPVVLALQEVDSKPAPLKGEGCGTLAVNELLVAMLWR